MSGVSESDLREQEAQIRRLQNDAMLKALHSVKRAQGIRYAPLTMAMAGIGTGAALFGAAIAFLKWIG